MYQYERVDYAGTRLHTLGRGGLAVVLAWALLTVVYLYVRVPLWNPDAPTLSSLLLAAELFGIVSLGLHLFCTWTLVERRAPRLAAGTRADIFVTTWNEPVEMLRHTLIAAKTVRQAGTVWLLDDGARQEMEELADELGVAYVSRTERAHAKAGNLNNALRHSTSDYIAIFDSDHVPSPDFLERTLGYFSDAAVAFVQTPQDFYNVDSFQHRGSPDRNQVWHEQTLFYRVIQPGKDRWNAAFFCGSCAVVRRRALDDIGGFATGTITEDLHTSLKMHKKGWSSAYHTEALAFGLAPSDFDQYQTQRLRWARGAMQVWIKEGFLFSKGLSLAQRLSYLASTSTYFEGWQKAIVYFMPIIVILTGWLPIAGAGPVFLTLFTSWLLAGMMVNDVVSRGYAKTVWMEEYNFFRYFTFMRATLALIIPMDWRFIVTPKGQALGTGTMKKLLPQALIGAGAAIALIVGTWLFVTRGHLPATAFAVTVIFLSFDLILSWKALKFAATRMRQRRSSHRFPIPLPVSIEGVASLAATIAEDVSSEGMMLTAPGLPQGRRIAGVLHLPDGDLPFRGTVVRRFEPAKVGIEFEWSSAAASDPLNTCLYGNTLQWDVNSWTEAKRKWVLPWAAKKNASHPGDWQNASLVSEGSDPIPCVARREHHDGPVWRVVSYARPKTQEGIKILTATEYMRDLQLAFCEALNVGRGHVYVSVVAADPKLASPTSHRHPEWSSNAVRARLSSGQPPITVAA